MLATVGVTTPSPGHVGVSVSGVTRALGKPERLVVTTNYGVLVSDPGAGWRFACDVPIRPEGLSYGRGVFPSVAAIGEVILIAPSPPDVGLFQTTDLGCSLIPVGDPEPTELSASADGAVIYATQHRAGEDVTRVHRRVVGSTTWERLGDIPGAAASVETDPSDAARLVAVTFLPPPRAEFALAVSTDRGLTWTQGPTLPEPGGVLKIHPRDGNVFFLSTGSGLYVSRSAGRAWQRTLLGVALAHALAPDGESVVVGSASTSGVGSGLHVVATSTLEVRTIYPGEIRCVAWTPSGIYACTHQCQHGFDLGWAPSADFSLSDTDWTGDRIPDGGATALRPLLAVERDVSAADCGNTDAAAACQAWWSEGIGLRTGCELPRVDAGTDDAAAAPQSSAPDGAADAGGVSVDPPTPRPSAGERAGNCACRIGTPPVKQRSHGIPAVAVLAMALLRRRTSRRVAPGRSRMSVERRSRDRKMSTNVRVRLDA